jgi:hypothetical protein
MNSRIIGLAFILGLLAPAAASAVTYDAFASFNGSNPAGSFRYVGATSPTTAVALISSGAACPLASTCLESPVGSIDSGVYKASAATPATIIEDGGTLTLPKDQLIVQPDLATRIFFIAPVAGQYTFKATFNALSDMATGVTILRATGNPAIMGGVTAALVGTTNGVPNALAYSEVRTLAAGDVFGFSIGGGPLRDFDLTGVNFSATSAPEPTTWAMMILGLAGAGVALRRRRAAASPPSAG